MAAWYAKCDNNPHGTRPGKWRGPARETQAKAQEDANKHDEHYGSHASMVEHLELGEDGNDSDEWFS